jgi:hypothetical protein
VCHDHPSASSEVPFCVGVSGSAHALSTQEATKPVFYQDFDSALGTIASGQLKDLQSGSSVDVLEVRRGTVLGYLTDGDYFGEASLTAWLKDDKNLRYAGLSTCYRCWADPGCTGCTHIIHTARALVTPVCQPR